MPHVMVKLYSDKSERQKQALAQAVTEAVTRTLNYGEESVSVGIEDVEPKDWTEKVYKPDVSTRSPDTTHYERRHTVITRDPGDIHRSAEVVLVLGSCEPAGLAGGFARRATARRRAISLVMPVTWVRAK